MEIESRLVFAGAEGRVMEQIDEVSFQDDENVLKLDRTVVMVAQPCKYVKNQ